MQGVTSTSKGDAVRWGLPVTTDPAGRLTPTQQASVLAAVRAIASAPAELERLRQVLAEQAQALTGADGAAVSAADGTELVMITATGTLQPHQGLRWPLASLLSGQALLDRVSVVSADAACDTRANAQVSHLLGIRSFAVVPLVADSVAEPGAGGAALGVLQVVSRHPRRFDAGTVEQLQQLAHVAAARLADAAELTRRHDRLNSAGVWGWDWDLVSGELRWDAAAAAIAGDAEDGRHGMAGGPEEVLTRVHPEDRAALRQVLAELAGGSRTAWEGSCRLLAADGTVRTARVRSQAVVGPDGQALRLRGTAQDVTHEHEIIRSLGDQQRLFEFAQRMAQLATWEYDAGTSGLSWSQQAYEMLGAAPGERRPTVRQVLSRVHPDDRRRIAALFAAMAQPGGQTEYSYAHRLRWPDGTVRHVLTWAEISRDSDGRLVRAVGTSRDVTDEHVSSESLRDSEQRFRLAFDRAAIGMSIVDVRPGTAGRLIRANQAMADLLGRPRAELPGQLITDFVHPDDVARDQATIARLQRGEISVATYEKRYRRPDGSPVWVLFTTSLARSSDGRPEYVVSQVLDITDRKQAEDDLRRLALSDPLTGLANRALLGDRLAQTLRRLSRQPGMVAVLLVGLDRFKAVNESLGRGAGDELLIEVGRRLTAAVRAGNTVARVGGDEFVVLIDHLTTGDDVHPLADRLVAQLRQPYDLPGIDEPTTCTASIGVAVADRRERTLDQLLGEAELALYRAKDAGRDRAALYDEALRARAVERLAAERRLRRAIDTGRLVVHYQPIVCLRTGRIAGAEALVRIDDPAHGLVPPAGFIDVAEDTGLVADIDGWVAEQAVAQAAAWPWLTGGGAAITINASARSLDRPDLVDRLQAALAARDLPPGRIHVEVTERVLLELSGTTRESLTRLGELRVPVGIDDFGTGYSALSYLHRYALDFVKIDRSFTSQLGVNSRGAAVVGAIIDLAHAHGLQVVAEGVETTEQLALLRRLSCDRAQGYLFARPVPAEQFTELAAAAPRW